jgi:hypothetical protein
MGRRSFRSHAGALRGEAAPPEWAAECPPDLDLANELGDEVGIPGADPSRRLAAGAADRVPEAEPVPAPVVELVPEAAGELFGFGPAARREMLTDAGVRPDRQVRVEVARPPAAEDEAVGFDPFGEGHVR